MAARRVRTLIVDDSAFIRTIVRNALSQHPQIDVVGMASDGVEALQMIAKLRPDVVTLDVEMPRLHGLGVLDRVAGKVPVAFVMVSTLTQKGARITFEALRRGAFDFVAKPDRAGIAAMPEFRTELHAKVLAAAQNKGRVRKFLGGDAPTAAPTLPPNKARGWLVAIGISCGGPQTLTQMLPAFPSDFVPILVTQHMPAGFTTSFARHLDECCAMSVREAQDGDQIRQGTILIAPGSHHMGLRRCGVDLRVKLDDGAKVSGHRPSADYMFSAVARVCGPRSVGVIMTGMGSDGAQGISEISKAGGRTVAQDEETSLVFGMPKVAIEGGCVDQIVPLPKLPMAIARVLAGAGRPAATRA
ncbi:MAG: chemotaxis response regulator protein-glutamate methylesterase [Planctomycetes bacterium]|nr:chemotaxis response regulator protein-glutamate methylesterase [Planctomycetota bacterium]